MKFTAGELVDIIMVTAGDDRDTPVSLILMENPNDEYCVQNELEWGLGTGGEGGAKLYFHRLKDHSIEWEED